MLASQVKTWLNVMQINYEYNEDIQRFETIWTVDGTSFKVIIGCRVDSWIQITALLLSSEDIPADKKTDLYEELLQQNWILDDVCYSMDDKGNIYSENDLPGQSSVENFLSELNAVVYGAKHFFQVLAPKLGLKSIPV